MADEPWLRCQRVPLVVRNATEQSVLDDAWIPRELFPIILLESMRLLCRLSGQQANQIQFDLQKTRRPQKRSLGCSSCGTVRAFLELSGAHFLSTKKLGSALEESEQFADRVFVDLERAPIQFCTLKHSTAFMRCTSQPNVDFCHWQSK